TEVAGLFEEVPAGFQEQPFLRVDLDGVAGQDAEEAGVEPVDAVDEAAVGGVEPVGCAGPRVVELPPREPVRRDLGDGVLAGGEQAPERVEVRCAGVAAADTDDGDVVGPDGGVVGGRGGRAGLGRGDVRACHGRGPVGTPGGDGGTVGL